MSRMSSPRSPRSPKEDPVNARNAAHGRALSFTVDPNEGRPEQYRQGFDFGRQQGNYGSDDDSPRVGDPRFQIPDEFEDSTFRHSASHDKRVKLRQAEQDAILLANRIALLEQECVRSNKKADSTAEKILTIVQARARNEEKRRMKEAEAREKAEEERRKKELFAQKKANSKFNKTDQSAGSHIKKRQAVEQAKMERAQAERALAAAKEYETQLCWERNQEIKRRNEERKIKKAAEAERIALIAQQNKEAKERALDEELNHRENEIQKLEEQEQRLLLKIKDTQKRQAQKWDLLTSVLEDETYNDPEQLMLELKEQDMLTGQHDGGKKKTVSPRVIPHFNSPAPALRSEAPRVPNPPNTQLGAAAAYNKPKQNIQNVMKTSTERPKKKNATLPKKMSKPSARPPSVGKDQGESVAVTTTYTCADGTQLQIPGSLEMDGRMEGDISTVNAQFSSFKIDGPDFESFGGDFGGKDDLFEIARKLNLK